MFDPEFTADEWRIRLRQEGPLRRLIVIDSQLARWRRYRELRAQMPRLSLDKAANLIAPAIAFFDEERARLVKSFPGIAALAHFHAMRKSNLVVAGLDA